jgi:transporter family-2 protein
MALAIGVSFAVQSGINAGLGRAVGSALFAALVSFSVGTVALIGASVVSGNISAAQTLRHVPVWMWLTGGLLGACVVYGSIFLVPRIGVAALAAFIIAGQLTAAAIIDHFGVFGVPVHEINLMRVAGIAMLFAGALLVRLA